MTFFKCLLKVFDTNMKLGLPYRSKIRDLNCMSTGYLEDEEKVTGD